MSSGPDQIKITLWDSGKADTCIGARAGGADLSKQRPVRERSPAANILALLAECSRVPFAKILRQPPALAALPRGQNQRRAFPQVLWHYVRDDTVGTTARATGLSANSVDAIFQKVRTYFFEAGLFTDLYDGAGCRRGGGWNVRAA